ncbi:MAG TPA: hypothetical protein VMG34_01080 [Bacteroidota bacterium]|nr:hypothetical protein [Bacteroidota bacterium]
MKYTLLLFSVCLAAGTATAQFTSGRFTTSFYGWQGRNSTLDKEDYLRAYENVQFNFAQDPFDFNTNFQLSKDFGTVIGTDPDLRLSSLVVRGRDIAGIADLSVGRQFVFAGVGNGLMDGAEVKGSLLDHRLGFTAYGGYNVIQSRDIVLKRDFADNSLVGGQLTYEPVDNAVVGLSFMDRTRKPEPFTAVRADSLFNPYVVVVAYSPDEEEYASLDASYSLLNKVSLYGRSDYDFNFERISRAQLEARAGIVSALTATVDYLFREPRVAYNSIFSVFNTSSTQEVEGGLEYQFSPLIRAFARFADVQYTDDNSSRLTVGGAYDIVNVSYTQNFGYAGDLDGISVQAVYPMMNRIVTPSLGFGYASYQLSDNAPKSTVINGSVGATYRPTPALSTDLQLQWMHNPLYSNDVRVFAKVNYWFSDHLSWF